MYKPELLLPVGDMKMCLAAIHNGADAIYLGMPKFNARGRSQDFSFEDLKEIIDMCHLYGVKVHVACNILIFQNEIFEVAAQIKKVIELGPDAIIVQDLGLVRLIKDICPEQVIHGSTQMTITNHEAIELLSDLDIDRFVLGRENSLDEIKIIKENTQKELEVFVHGALCVAYSGQCFTSESIGGRSANRGQCAQSCRFDYELIVDGKKHQLLDRKYLVSPKDLCGIKEIPKLQQLGVESFKVEGRLKSFDYVGTVARSYREAIDNYQSLNLKNSIAEMQITYSRGFHSGWLNSVAHQELVDASFSNHRGFYIGKIHKIMDGKIFAKNLLTKLKNGDGILIVGDNENQKIGGQIYGIKESNNISEITLSRSLDLSQIKSDHKIYLNRDESIIKGIENTIQNKDYQKKIPIKIKLDIKASLPLKITVRDERNEYVIIGDSPVQSAINRPTTEEEIKKHLLGLSHTVYAVVEFFTNLDEQVFIPNTELKSLKRKMVDLLNKSRTSNQREISSELSLELKKSNTTTQYSSGKLNILVRNYEQLETTIDYFLKNSNNRNFLSYIILDYEFGADYVKSIKKLKETNLPSAIATTRILKPTEYHNFKLIQRADPDAILIRNLGALNYFKNSKFTLFGDFSLNCANSLTFEYLTGKGLSSICASYDLNAKRLFDLVSSIESGQLEVTIHQYMPEFHMEHCVFAAFLSNGNSFRDCGRPCEKHKVQLKDMYGAVHELKADMECRNTMYNAQVMSAVELIPYLLKSGVNLFRFEGLNEHSQEFVQKLDLYFSYVSGTIQAEVLKLDLNKIETYGVTSGQLYNSKNYRDRKKEF